ncbi:MAG: class A beta-lactamase [Gammaproteobacteria bacterium]
MASNWKTHFSRRRFLLASASLPLLSACGHSECCTSNTGAIRQAQDQLIEIERGTGGRIGVAGANLHTGITLSHRQDERFAMCSTFKWLLAATILRKVERGEESLERTLSWTAEDLIVWSLVTKPMVETSGSIGRLSIGELCSATMRTSDNTAANLLLETVGGPAGLTQAIRKMGDRVTRLDRTEPSLNQNRSGDPRDTSTPMAMLSVMRDALYGEILQSESQGILKKWLVSNETGTTRLRAGLPTGWLVGDRSGTSSNNANNNVAFAEPPAGTPPNGPLLIVSFTNAPNPTLKEANAVHAHIARVISDALI